MRQPFSKRLIILASVALFAFVAVSIFSARNRVAPPIHIGQPLTYWAKQHPSQYYAAVRALGTNALPYLIGELHAQDSAPARLLQHAIGKVISIGEIFTRARHRRYYARLGLQQLDTNAVPALLDIFVTAPANRSAPIALEHFDVAWALSWITSPEAEAMKLARFTNFLSSNDAADKILACNGLTHALSAPPPTDVTAAIAELASHPDPRLRQAVMIYFSHHRSAEDLALPLLVRSVTDTNELVRRLAFNALQYRTTNATSAIPALLTLYSNTPPSSLRDELRHTVNLIAPARRLR
jgi:hypothetical protein